MANDRPNILVLFTPHMWQTKMTNANRKKLAAIGRYRHVPEMHELSQAEFASLFEGVDGVLTTWGARPIDETVLRRADRLRIVAHAAGSVRWVVPRMAIERGIVVTSAAAAIARTVAEHALLLMIALLRRLPLFLDPMRMSAVTGGTHNAPSRTLWDKTVGIIGFGNVGRHLAGLLRPFHVRVLVHDPFVAPERVREHAAEWVELDELLANSDVVSLHCPYVDATEKFIDADKLARMRDGAVFINTARGGNVDQDALIAELIKGRLWAGLDVATPDPGRLPRDHPLARLPNVILTPHIAGPTTDDLPRLAAMALDDMAAFFAGRPPQHVIDLQAYELQTK